MRSILRTSINDSKPLIENSKISFENSKSSVDNLKNSIYCSKIRKRPGLNKRLLTFCVLVILCITMAMNALASELKKVVDEADLLTDSEEAELEARADSVSENSGMDVVILTTNGLGQKSATEYADDYFDYNGYGQGDDYDGILLLIDMDSRSWAISTSGGAIYVFSDYGQELIMDEILPDLSDGEFYQAFDRFISLCDEYIEDAGDGNIVDAISSSDYYSGEVNDVSGRNSSSLWTNNLFLSIVVALAFGFLLAGIPIAAWKKKLKNVHFNSGASEYLRPGSFELTVSRDTYLYHTVVRTPKPKDNGGSSTHTGSSGHSHGGSSGHF